VPDSIALEDPLQHYFQFRKIWNRFAHYFAGKNRYFIVAKIVKAMDDSWLAIGHWKITNFITLAAEELKRYLSKELSSNCIIETNTSVTRVIEGDSLGDD